MSDIEAKIHQIRFRRGISPRPRWGAYSAPPNPLLDLRGHTSKGREGRQRERRGTEEKGLNRASIRPPPYFFYCESMHLPYTSPTNASFGKHKERWHQMDAVWSVQGFSAAKTLQSGWNRLGRFFLVQMTNADLLRHRCELALHSHQSISPLAYIQAEVRGRGGLGRLAVARWPGWSAGQVGHYVKC